MPAYIVAHVTMNDPSWMESEYMAVLHSLMDRYGGRAIAAGQHEHLEGGPIGMLTVIDEFPDIEAARAFWNDPEYQRVVPLRQAGSVAQVVLIDGAGDQ